MKDTAEFATDGKAVSSDIRRVHTLVIGSGAAGLCAAVRLRAEGVDDVRIVTEGLAAGTSINTGSDKQTYYKLSLCGDETGRDSPVEMAKTYRQAGAMHGDLALVEAAVSARAFLHLVDLGVPFPTDAFGQFVGYKTDHDPRRRATSIGPYTSRAMCRALIRRVRELAVPIDEGVHVVELLTIDENIGENNDENIDKNNGESNGNMPGKKRIAGAITLCESNDAKGRWRVYLAENVVFAVGGPGGLYETSVYPTVQTGAIGLALQAGAEAVNLPESQFGLASIKHRWNVSGTYMQVIPRIVSTAADGTSDEREFLREWFGSVGETGSLVFLKGYQWPFDSRKVIGGSSLIDLLVHRETAVKGRRVFLDYRSNPAELDFGSLSDEAKTYLANSGVLPQAGQVASTPIARLATMNPAAIQLYLDYGIDLRREKLEVALCAQHNNGGLAGTHWWESTNLRHLFPVGEVNGSHGVARPGGSALNAGQVGAFRAAEYLAHCYADWTLDLEAARQRACRRMAELAAWCERAKQSNMDWQSDRRVMQRRMSRCSGAIRSLPELENALSETTQQYERLLRRGVSFTDARGQMEALRNVIVPATALLRDFSSGMIIVA
ncbi:MAG: FAD-binding protein [Planctomycetaceae bacterium]|nr:FAD-binding protein [Planctomycetaceae bacterium]